MSRRYLAAPTNQAEAIAIKAVDRALAQLPPIPQQAGLDDPNAGVREVVHVVMGLGLFFGLLVLCLWGLH